MLQMSHEVGGVISWLIHYYSTSHSKARSMLCSLYSRVQHASCMGYAPAHALCLCKAAPPGRYIGSCKCTHCRWCICAVCCSILWLHAPVSCRECWSHIARRRELLKNDLRSHAAHEAW